ncbi:hypothetical protein VTO73DRAFT_9534 [Trametes versicolor]
MVFLSSFFCLAGVVVSVLGSEPKLSPRVLHEHRRSLPSGWSLHRRADPEITLPLSIALVQSNIDNLEDYLLDIADPDSPNYGMHWTPARVRDTFRPSQESVDVVHTWLASDGVHPERVQFSPDGMHLRVDVSVSEAERLLATEYYVYQHEDGSEHLACQRGYHLPEHVSRHVELVKPTIQFTSAGSSGPVTSIKRSDSRRSLARRAGAHKPSGVASYPAKTITGDPLDHCDEQVTLDCLRALYDFYYDLQAPDQNSIGVVELGAQNYNGHDLDLFFQKFNIGRLNDRPKLISIDGGKENVTQTDDGLIGEANLDFELVMGLLDVAQPVLLYQIGRDGFVDDLLSAFDTQYCIDIGTKNCKDKPHTNVVSISYGTSETGPHNEMIRQCNEMGKVALTGVTFVYASGDDGPSFGGTCLDDDGNEVDGEGNFLPDFPGVCQYLTAVGATQVNPGSSPYDPESATAGFASGGGFSNVFKRPKFQERHVARYLKKADLPYGPNVFNRTGRAYPDVAANGWNITVVGDGVFSTNGGTSASAPIFAAMLTAVNDARIAVGKSPVGWINPAIYSHWFASVWNDITDGSNPACGTDGFPTAPGWDPVTGLGTPNFPRMLARFLALP